MRILFVKLGAIGDLVHALPALAAVRRAFPDIEIDWAVESRSAEILRDNPMIDRLIEVDTSAIRETRSPKAMYSELKIQAGSLRERGYEAAIDLQGLLKSAMIARLSGAPRRVGFGKRELREPLGRFLLTERIVVPGGLNVIDKNLQLVRSALDIRDPQTRHEFPIATSQQHRDEAARIAAEAGDRFAILNPAGGWVTKLWPAENYGGLADRLWDEQGLVSIVVTGPKEVELAERAVKGSRSGRLIASQPSLKGFYELARSAAVYIGGDTGPTHIAVAAGAPVVGIFGPTEWWRNGSPRAEDICVGREDIGCRVDCHRRKCSNWICMDIDVDTVADAVAARLSRVSEKEALA